MVKKGMALLVYLIVFFTVFSICILSDYSSKTYTHNYQENRTSTVVDKHLTHYQEYHCTMQDGVCTNGYYTEGTNYYLDLQDGTKQKVPDVHYNMAKNGDTWNYTATPTGLKPGENATPRLWTIIPPVLSVGICVMIVVTADYEERLIAQRRARLKESGTPIKQEPKHTEKEIILTTKEPVSNDNDELIS